MQSAFQPSSWGNYLLYNGLKAFFSALLVLFLLGIGIPQASAQKYAEWKEGSVVLAHGDTLAGKIYINLEEDLVEVDNNGTLKAYGPFQVLLVRLYDPPRLYTCHEAALRGTMQVPTFFEVIFPGAYATLLNRERISQNNQAVLDQYGQNNGTFYGQNQYQNDFFVLNSKGKVRRLPSSRKELARFFENQPPHALVDYIKRNKPDPSSKDDMVGLMAFYNHLKADQLPAH
jgi:hypothetical protein